MKTYIAQEEDNKIVQNRFDAEERSKIINAPAGNRTRGPTMGMLDFTTKPLALPYHFINSFTYLYTHITHSEIYNINHNIQTTPSTDTLQKIAIRAKENPD